MAIGFFSSFILKVDDWVQNAPPWIQNSLQSIENKTRIHKVYTSAVLIILMCWYMMVGRFAQLLCNIFGLVLPCYFSIEALERGDKEDYAPWLIYWVTFAAFCTMDFFAVAILRYFPPYWLAKLIFLFWLSYPPRKNGAIQVFDKYILPKYREQRPSIQLVIGSIQLPSGAGSAQQDAGLSPNIPAIQFLGGAVAKELPPLFVAGGANPTPVTTIKTDSQGSAERRRRCKQQ